MQMFVLYISTSSSGMFLRLFHEHTGIWHGRVEKEEREERNTVFCMHVQWAIFFCAWQERIAEGFSDF